MTTKFDPVFQVTVLAPEKLISDGQGEYGLLQGKLMIQYLSDNFSQPYFDHFPKLGKDIENLIVFYPQNPKLYCV